MNKKGNLIAILLVTGGIILLLFIAVLIAFGVSTLNTVTETVVPEFTGLGQVGDWNASESFDITLTPVQNIIVSFNWLGGVIFVFCILGMFAFAFAFRNSSEKWVIPLFFLLMVLVILISIFISNIYEEFYTGTDTISTGLQNQGILSFMILYSPTIFAICGFIAGGILFSGQGEQTA